MSLEWQRRDHNVAADKLTNSDFSDFDMTRRITPDLDHMPWIVLPSLMNKAADLYKAQSLVNGAKTQNMTPPKARRTRVEPLRTRDPW